MASCHLQEPVVPNGPFAPISVSSYSPGPTQEVPPDRYIELVREDVIPSYVPLRGPSIILRTAFPEAPLWRHDPKMPHPKRGDAANLQTPWEWVPPPAGGGSLPLAMLTPRLLPRPHSLPPAGPRADHLPSVFGPLSQIPRVSRLPKPVV